MGRFVTEIEKEFAGILTDEQNDIVSAMLVGIADAIKAAAKNDNKGMVSSETVFLSYIATSMVSERIAEVIDNAKLRDELGAVYKDA